MPLTRPADKMEGLLGVNCLKKQPYNVMRLRFADCNSLLINGNEGLAYDLGLKSERAGA